MSDFTHFNEQGRARMVDISSKNETERTAVARSSVHVNEEIYVKITENQIDKGDVLGVAKVAGVKAAKKTPDLIPMFPPLQLKSIDISFIWENVHNNHEIQNGAFVKTKGSSGVEMEALTAA